MMRQLPSITADPLAFLLRMRQRYGPVVQFPIPDSPTFLVDDTHIVRSVLIAHDDVFDKDTVQYRALAEVTGEGLLAARNAEWRVQRPVVQPAFHRRVTGRLVADSEASAQRLADRWALAPAGSIVDAEAAMMRVGLEVVGRHLFDADLQHAAPRLARATLDALDAVVASVRLPWALLGPLPTPVRGRFRRALDHLGSAVADLVSARLAAGEAGRRDDLLGLLLAAYPADARIVRDQIVTFLVAGHETVAAALTWSLGLLAFHPDEQQRLRAEAVRVLGERSLAESDLAHLPATRSAVDEALRLYPPAWVITRSAARNMVLGGRLIPAGALVIMSPWVRHRDPARWPAPDAFRPDRFASDGTARAATARGEYLPFGAGQRLCIGRDAALLEAQVVLATLLRRFAFSPAEDRLPPAEPAVTLRPSGGLRLCIRPAEARVVSRW